MLERLAVEFQHIAGAVHNNLYFVLFIVAVLWLIHLFNWGSGYQLNRLGIYPRTKHGIFGIIFSPFIHGSFDHLFLNSVPLFSIWFIQFLCSFL